MSRKQPSVHPIPVPKVRIAAPSGRPLQVRYHCPQQVREIRLSVGSRDWEEAEALKSEVEARLLLGISVQSQSEKTRGPEMDWQDFREEYRCLHLNTVRDKTAQDAESQLDIAERIIKPKTLGKMAETPVLQTLQARLLAGDHSRNKRPRSVYTVRGYMKAVLAALNWAYRQDWLEREPKLPRLRTPKGNPMKGRPIDEMEFERLLKAVPGVVGQEAAESWEYVLRGLWESALRIDELMNVSWDQPGKTRPIWDDGKLPVLQIPADMQKNGTHDTIPILPGFEQLLLETPAGVRHGWIFNPRSLQSRLGRKTRHERPTSEWVGRIISKIGKASGIIVVQADESQSKEEKFVSAHDLRRSCGERLRNANIPPLVISRVMRHSSWETTQKHYAPGNVQNDCKSLREKLGEL